jgi:hypothetical protein
MTSTGSSSACQPDKPEEGPMIETVRGGAVPFLLRGFLRLLVLATPLFVLFAVLGSDDRRVTWVDTRTAFGAEPSLSTLGAPRTGTQVQGEAQVRYVVDQASVGLWLINLLPAFVLAVAISAVAFLLLRTMRETYAGRPFSGNGVRRLRLVAAVVGTSAIVVPLLSSVSSHAIVARVLPEQAPGIYDRWDILGATIPWLVVALIVLAVAEAFDIGAGLADDVDGLV